MPTAADAALVRGALRGDREAFGQLVDRHRARVYTLALRMVGERARAEDIASEAFLRVWDALERYDPSRSFATWVLTIASRLCLDELRRARSRVGSLEEEREAGRAEPAAEQAGPEELALTAQIGSTVREAIDRLPERERMAVLLRHLEDLSYDEIAQAMRIPVGTAKTHAYQGRLKLARALRGMEEGEAS